MSNILWPSSFVFNIQKETVVLSLSTAGMEELGVTSDWTSVTDFHSSLDAIRGHNTPPKLCLCLSSVLSFLSGIFFPKF